MHGEPTEAEDDPSGAPGEAEASPASGEDEPSSQAPSTAPDQDVDPLAQAQAEAAKNKDGWLRTAADFDNFRKRSRRDLDDARRGGREDLVRAFLPIFDNLDRAIQSSVRSSDVKAMVEGLAMIQRQFVDALAREGIARIPTIGQPFDPSIHEAIQQVETDEHPPGTVIAEVQSGYTQGERLMRAAMVVVARPKADASAEAGDSGAEGPGAAN
jgi:molecular chaperone GrpE